MAIKSVDKMWSKASSDVKLTDNFRKFDIGFVAAYQVLHDANEPELNIYQAEGIPAAGSSFPGFPFCYADGASIERVSPIFSIVTITYSGEIAKSVQGTSPLLSPPKIDWDDVETEEEVDEDFLGFPIVTKNYEQIAGLKRPIPDQTVTIRRNMATFNPYVQARYRQAVNSDTFLGWPAGTARLTKFAASNVYDKDLGYWEITAQIQFRYPYKTIPARAWYKRVRHEGFYVRVNKSGGGTAIVRAVDYGLREPVTKPVLLDENGYQLPEGALAHWLEFRIFDSLPFNALGLL